LQVFDTHSTVIGGDAHFILPVGANILSLFTQALQVLYTKCLYGLLIEI
jgi:hypothetical protein